MKSTLMKKAGALFLSLALLVSLIPQMTFAEDPEPRAEAGTRELQLGVSGISGYDSVNNSYDYIYFGYNSTLYGPIKWRVLDTKTNMDNAVEGDGLFLLSERVISTMPFADSSSAGLTWNSGSCSAQIWCRELYQGNKFTDNEKSAVIFTNKTDKSLEASADLKVCWLEDSTFFFLSYGEMHSNTYGLQRGDNGIAYNLSSIASEWWGRSVFLNSSRPNYVNKNTGGVGFASTATETKGARPAFNLDPSKVLFITKPKTPLEYAGAKVSEIPAYDGNEWLLTLKDETRNNVTAETDDEYIRTSTRLIQAPTSVTYANAPNGTKDFISAMITNKSGGEEIATHYKKLKKVADSSDTSGTTAIDLSGISMTKDDTLYIFSEQANGNQTNASYWKTNYASDLKPVMPLNAYDVTTNVTNLASSNQTDYLMMNETLTNAAEDYTTEFTATGNYVVPDKDEITITVGGQNLNASDYEYTGPGKDGTSGTLTIPAEKIKGDVKITASGIAKTNLGTPGPTWDSNAPGKISWPEVTNAESYEIELFKNGTGVNGTKETLTTKEKTFDGTVLTAPGSYTVKVTAKSSRPRYLDSQTAESGKLHTVTFDTTAGGSTPPAMQLVKSGEKVTEPDDPTKTEFIFRGWKNGTEDWNFGTDTVTAPLTLTAAWEDTDYAIAEEGNKNTLSFAPKNQGYQTAPDTQEITIVNEGNSKLTLNMPTGKDFTVQKKTGTDDFELDAGEKITFTVQPKNGLEATGLVSRTYEEDLVFTNGRTDGKKKIVTVRASFTVNPIFQASIVASPDTIIKGYETAKLTAGGTGGAGEAAYKYQWYTVDESTKAETALTGETGKTLDVSPASTTTYRVKIDDGIEEKSADQKITVKEPQYNVTIAGTGGFDGTFADACKDYANITAKEIIVTNNSDVTISASDIVLTAGVQSKFTLTKKSGQADTITKGGGTMTFTVTPKNDLAVQDNAYTDSVKFDKNQATAAFPLSFSVKDHNYAWESISDENHKGTCQRDNTHTTTESHVEDKPSGKCNVCGFVMTEIYTISVNKTSLNLGTKNAGYTAAPTGDVTVTNTGNSEVTLTIGVTGDFTRAGDAQQVTIPVNGSTTVRVQPVMNLPANGDSQKTYTGTLTIGATKGSGTHNVDLTFKVNPELTVSIDPAKTAIADGKSVTLTAEATGGSGTYTYTWYAGTDATGAPIGTGQTLTQTPRMVEGKDTTYTYTVVVADTIGTAPNTATVTVEPPKHEIEIPVGPGDGGDGDGEGGGDAAFNGAFGNACIDYSPIDARTITITNTGNMEIENLTAELTGNDATSFDLNTANITGPGNTTLNPGQTVTITVKPNTGLQVKDYTAEVKISGKGIADKPLDISFTVTEHDWPDWSYDDDTNPDNHVRTCRNSWCQKTESVKHKEGTDGRCEDCGKVMTPKYDIDVENPDPENPDQPGQPLTALDFGTKNAGYSIQNLAQTFKVKNKGNSDVTLQLKGGEPANYDVTLPKDPIKPGETGQVTVTPKEGLNLEGPTTASFNEDLKLTTVIDDTQEISLSLTFTVNPALIVTVSADQGVDKEMKPGETVTLTANVTGGSGIGTYNYQWYANGTLLDGKTEAELQDTPKVTTTYKVEVTDEVETRPVTQLIQVASSGGGGGYPVTYYRITALPTENGTIELERETIWRWGSVDVTLKPEEGYEVEKLLINGKNVGTADRYTIEDITEDIEVEAVFKETEAHRNARIKEGVQKTTIKAWSKAKKGAILVYFRKSYGFKMDGYEFYRSTKKNKFGKTPYYVSEKVKTKGYMNNTKNLKKGIFYFYKVRGYRTVAKEKVFTKWSNQAIRMAKK